MLIGKFAADDQVRLWKEGALDRAGEAELKHGGVGASTIRLGDTGWRMGKAVGAEPLIPRPHHPDLLPRGERPKSNDTPCRTLHREA